MALFGSDNNFLQENSDGILKFIGKTTLLTGAAVIITSFFGAISPAVIGFCVAGAVIGNIGSTILSNPVVYEPIKRSPSEGDMDKAIAHAEPEDINIQQPGSKWREHAKATHQSDIISR